MNGKRRPRMTRYATEGEGQLHTLGLLEQLRCRCKCLWGASSEAYFRVDRLLRQLADPNLHDDDTVDVVHGHQQLAQWNAHYNERCFLPIHVYDAATDAPVTVILRPGKTPSGVEVRKLLSRLIGRIRRHWPNTHITIRGDGHYGREEAMTWCENYGIDYIFGLSGNVVLDRLVEAAAADIRVRRAVNQAEVLRGFAETRYAAKSWDKERRVVARIEASASHADDMQLCVPQRIPTRDCSTQVE